MARRDIDPTTAQLNDALTLIRCGCYDDAKTRIAALGKTEHPVPPPRRPGAKYSLAELRLATMRAEISDHFGDTRESAKALKKYAGAVDEELEKCTKKSDPVGASDGTRKLLRQELFFSWQISCLEYRQSVSKGAQQLIDVGRRIESAIRIANRMSSPPRGLLSQLLYGKGRLLAQERRLDEAITTFHESLTNVKSRFE